MVSDKASELLKKEYPEKRGKVLTERMTSWAGTLTIYQFSARLLLRNWNHSYKRKSPIPISVALTTLIPNSGDPDLDSSIGFSGVCISVLPPSFIRISGVRIVDPSFSLAFIPVVI